MSECTEGSQLKVCDGFIISSDKLNTLYESTQSIEKNEIMARLASIYNQSVELKKTPEDIIECFVVNNFDVLNTLKSLYINKIDKNNIGVQKHKSINQLRMSEIRKIMSERDKVRDNMKNNENNGK